MLRQIKRRNDRSGRRVRTEYVDVADQTGPLDVLKDMRVTAFFDVENLRGGAMDLGLKLSFGTLSEKLSACCASSRLHAVFSRERGDDRQTEYLQKSGFVPHPREIEVVSGHRGVRRLTNSDETLLFLAGRYISRGQTDVVLIGSGDGDLVCELAKNIRVLPRERMIYTLSLAGSTSQRLESSKNEWIDGNIELGMDVFRPLRRHRTQVDQLVRTA